MAKHDDDISAQLDEALQVLRHRLRTVAGRQIILFSDFDGTLCDEYVFDAVTNNHIARIDPGLVAAAQRHHLVIATSRRVSNPTVPLFWQSGLVPAQRLVIAENGGVILQRRTDGTINYIDLISPAIIKRLELLPALLNTIEGIPTGQRPFIKQGRTSAILGLQDRNGLREREHQYWLLEHLRPILPEGLLATNTGSSIAVHHETVNKAVALRKYLELANFDRDRIFVIGLGDAENDVELFQAADLRIGLSHIVAPLVDISVPLGPKAMPYILDVIAKY